MQEKTLRSIVGLGKPEALKHELMGLWSRRITSEHRLVYSIDEENIFIYSCKGQSSIK